MKRFGCICVLFCLLVGSFALRAQSNGFQIIYLADTKYAKDPVWLDKMKADWSATGINLRIWWSEVEKGSLASSDDVWTGVDSALYWINQKGLDAYIRVSFIFTNTNWYSQLNSVNDFHRGSDGNYYYNNNFGLIGDVPNVNGDRRMLNFISANSRAAMKGFFQKVVQHLNVSPYRNRIKLIVPTMSQDDESEWPSLRQGVSEPHMAGYSALEQGAFRTFLSAKYSNNISNLNAVWGSNYLSFNSIYIDDPSNNPDLNWHRQPLLSQPQYIYPKGRKDWIDFRAQELKKFFEELQSITVSYSQPDFQFGLQIGSLYDHLLTFRTSYDPTSLFEKVDYVITGEVPEYDVNFYFAADYLRSLGRYWDWKNSRTSKIKFATESNWPGYNNLSADTLSKYWERQVNAFYGRGASALFVSHWGTTDTGDGLGIPGMVKNGTLPPAYYSLWKPTLATRFKNVPLQNISHYFAAHLSCEQSLYFRADSGLSGSKDYFYNNGFELPGRLGVNHLGQDVKRVEYPFYRFLRPRGVYSQNNALYRNWSDIVTNYMLINSPTYITSNYTELHFTATSEIIPEAAYLNVMRNGLKDISMSNDTHFSDAGHGEYAFTAGIRNEYKEIRSPIHLVWRTRPDLKAIWPDASLPAPGNGWVIDFVLWAFTNGSGQDNPNSPQREYPGWMLKDTNGKYAYDKNIRAVWNQDATLQTNYNNAHDRSVPSGPISMIEWAKLNPSRPQDGGKLNNYNYWPYIGGGINVKISGPTTLGYKQNGTWTAIVSGGSGTITYQWYISFDNGFLWSTLGTGQNQTYTMLNQSFRLRCNVTRSGAIATDIHDVAYLLVKASNSNLPQEFALHNNYPNPFNPSTSIKYDLPREGNVSLVIFDIMGRKVLELENAAQEAGYHEVMWHGVNANGQLVGSGVYFVRLIFSDNTGKFKFEKVKKMMLLK